MPINPFSTVMSNFNVYNKGRKLMGVSGEITLPTLEQSKETIKGAGILGEFEVPITGHYGPMQLEIPFTSIVKDVFSLAKNSEYIDLTLRGGVDEFDTAGGKIRDFGIIVDVRGKHLSLELGKFMMAGKMDSKIKLEVYAMKVTVDKKVVFDYDKLNVKCVIAGVDQIAELKKNI